MIASRVNFRGFHATVSNDLFSVFNRNEPCVKDSGNASSSIATSGPIRHFVNDKVTYFGYGGYNNGRANVHAQPVARGRSCVMPNNMYAASLNRSSSGFQDGNVPACNAALVLNLQDTVPRPRPRTTPHRTGFGFGSQATAVAYVTANEPRRDDYARQPNGAPYRK